MKPNNKWMAFLSSSALISGALLVNVLFGAIIILLIGSDPVVAYKSLLHYSLGDPVSFTNVLTRATPLLLAGLSVSVAFTAGIYNLGGEGQIYLGAFAAALVGFSLNGLTTPIHLSIIIIAAMLAGAIGAFIPGWLKVKYNVDEVVSTILLNSVYILFTNYLANYPFRDPTRWSGTTLQVLDSARMPVIYRSTELNAGIIISLFFVFIIFIIFRSSDLGYRWKIIGLNKRFSMFGGIASGRDQLIAMIFSGSLAGLAGGLLVTGSQYRFWAQIGGGVGWDGVLIALLANNNPLGVLIAGLGFAVVKTGSLAMEQASSVPSELTNVLLALLILFITGRKFAFILLQRKKNLVDIQE